MPDTPEQRAARALPCWCPTNRAGEKVIITGCCHELQPRVEREIREAVAAERERCARIAEERVATGTYEAVTSGIAAAIREGRDAD